MLMDKIVKLLIIHATANKWNENRRTKRMGLLICWLTDWLSDWLTDWLSDWLIDWLTVWLIDWLTVGCWLLTNNRDVRILRAEIVVLVGFPVIEDCIHFIQKCKGSQNCCTWNSVTHSHQFTSVTHSALNPWPPLLLLLWRLQPAVCCLLLEQRSEVIRRRGPFDCWHCGSELIHENEAPPACN